MTAGQRRESILEAAARAFARTGYAGTSTATIAVEAHVSQPYVIQMFGSKGELFRSVYERADHAVMQGLHAALRESSSLGLDSTEQIRRTSWTFLERLPDRTPVRIVMHGFLTGDKCPEVSDLARRSMVRLYRTIEEVTGCSARQSGNIVGQLILAGALLSLDAPGDRRDPALAGLADAVFGSGRMRVEAS